MIYPIFVNLLVELSVGCAQSQINTCFVVFNGLMIFWNCEIFRKIRANSVISVYFFPCIFFFLFFNTIELQANFWTIRFRMNSILPRFAVYINGENKKCEYFYSYTIYYSLSGKLLLLKVFFQENKHFKVPRLDLSIYCRFVSYHESILTGTLASVIFHS